MGELNSQVTDGVIVLIDCYRLTFGPQADRHRSFERWHKAYHGTSPGRVRPILDNGGLMLPGKSYKNIQSG